MDRRGQIKPAAMGSITLEAMKEAANRGGLNAFAAFHRREQAILWTRQGSLRI